MSIGIGDLVKYVGNSNILKDQTFYVCHISYNDDAIPLLSGWGMTGIKYTDELATNWEILDTMDYNSRKKFLEIDDQTKPQIAFMKGYISGFTEGNLVY